jgi:hypothetical protein
MTVGDVPPTEVQTNYRFLHMPTKAYWSDPVVDYGKGWAPYVVQL